MYKYDQYDQAVVDTRVEEFRDQVARRIAVPDHSRRATRVVEPERRIEPPRLAALK